MREFVRKHEVWVFFATLLVANTLFVTGIGLHYLPGRAYNVGRFVLLGGVLAVIVFYSRGWQATKNLLKPMLRWRTNPLWYIFAFCCAAAIGTVVLIGKGFYTGKGLAVFELTPEVPFYPHLIWTILIGSFIAEMVWVSYAMNQLKSRVPLYVASQITGVAWSLWWMPMVYFNIGVMLDLPPLSLTINMMGAAAVAGFIYAKTNSGLCVLVLQIMLNSSALIFPVIPETGGIPTYVAFSIVYWVVGTALFLIFRPGRKMEPAPA